MKSRTYGSPARLAGIAATLVLAAAGCKTKNPAQPSTAASGTGVSIVAPSPAAPANGTAVAFVALPVKLTVNNAVATNGTPLTYTFEVAYDSGFASKIFTKDASQGANGQTTVTADTLLANNTYFWHARASGGGTTGVFGPTYQFRVGGPVTLSSPALQTPRDGEFVAAQPTLVVTNVTKTGPAGAITYKFEVSDTVTFASIVASATVNEGSVLTQFPLTSALPIGKTYFWRVTAIDAANGVSSVSATRNFSTISSVATLLAAEEGQVLWPGVQPPGQPGALGHDIYGDNWDVGEKVYINGVHYMSPELETLRIMDLIDRGLPPGDAVNWMKANGYPTVALYYPAPLEVIGFTYQYMAGLDPVTGKTSAKGYWNLVDRAE